MIFRPTLVSLLVAASLVGFLPLQLCQAQPEFPLDALLEKAGNNRIELTKAWEQVPAEHRAGLKFLLENMPERDLQTLSATFLLNNLSLAYQTRKEVAWGEQIPEEIFLNDVLPYANINERRDAWRQDFHDKFLKVVQDIKSPSLAAAKLNQTIFPELNVKYSTKRRRADQGPKESIESGLASCTGLSILLIDACRAVGIPARFVGTPLWSDKSGNHSWVEVWDNGWHFTGAAEPAGDDLDKAWFIDRASTAQMDVPEHAIYAVSFRRTPIHFPMVWDRDNHDVFAINVTERYLKLDRTLPAGFVRLRFKTLTPMGRDRCQANVVVRDQSGNVVFRGQSKDERFDSNDHLTAALPAGQQFEVEVRHADGVIRESVVANEDGKLVTIQAASPTTAVKQLEEYLKLPRDGRPPMAQQSFATVPLSAEDCTAAIALLVQDHRSHIKQSRQAEMQEKRIRIADAEMPFELIAFGDKPEKGHSLVISMHGGGGAPKSVNDRQWENQKKLYELEEGLYVAPRAPTDSWNMWHQAHIDVLFTRLVENLIAVEGIDPDRVFITGYSAGGDGVFQLAPRMADQLAAAAMMAGHPNETKPLGLRNLPFTLHMGGKDAAYNRNTVAQSWADELAKLKAADPTGYEHWVKIYPDKGHWMDREDRAGVQWLFKYRRNIIPERVVWLQDDVVHNRFYWLGAKTAKAGDLLIASRRGNVIEVEQSPTDAVAGNFSIWLRDDMLNLDQEVVLRQGERELWRGQATRTIASISQTLEDRGDPQAIFSARIDW